MRSLLFLTALLMLVAAGCSGSESSAAGTRPMQGNRIPTRGPAATQPAGR